MAKTNIKEEQNLATNGNYLVTLIDRKRLLQFEVLNPKSGAYRFLRIVPTWRLQSKVSNKIPTVNLWWSEEGNLGNEVLLLSLEYQKAIGLANGKLKKMISALILHSSKSEVKQTKIETTSDLKTFIMMSDTNLELKKFQASNQKKIRKIDDSNALQKVT